MNHDYRPFVIVTSQKALFKSGIVGAQSGVCTVPHHDSSTGELIVIRIFHHYVSRIAFMLLLLELSILLSAAVASAPL